MARTLAASGTGVSLGPSRRMGASMTSAAHATGSARASRVTRSPGRPPTTHGGPLRVLLVEDSAADVAWLRRLVPSDRFELVVRSRMADAVRSFATEVPPDVVLLDLGLPDARGLEAVDVMRRAARLVPIVVLTGNSRPELGREAVRGGADDFLLKGQIDADRLVRTLDLAIERTKRASIAERLTQSEGLASLGRLAASVAHDVNNPATYIRLSLDLAAQHVGELRVLYSDARLDECATLLSEAREGAEHIVALVADLKALGRAERRTVEIVSLDSVIATACRLAKNELYHRAHLTVDVEPGLELKGYRTRLLQAVSNLLLNAAQAFDAGQASDNEVAVRARRRGGSLEIVVSDSGRGMPAHIRDTAFEPFVTTRPGGTGIGLALVRAIAEEHGGTVLLDSELGRGTEVSLILPLQNVLVLDTVPPPISLRAPAPAGLRILLVDDDDLVRRAITRILRGHDVVGAAGGEEALRLLEENANFDVIITDLMMPNMYGPELLARIEATWPELAQRAVVCTGGAMTAEAERLLAARATVVQKPVGREDLLAAVDRAARSRAGP